MNAPTPPDPDDSRREYLRAFDESIRFGATPTSSPLPDQELRELERLLVQLNSAWVDPAKQLLCGYPLIRNLGQGTIGPTFLVRETEGNQPLVLRILWPELAANSKVRSAFLADAATARALTMPAIVTVKAFGNAGAVCFVASRFTVGQSLADWRTTHVGAAPWTTVARFFARLASVVGAAHDRGFTHGNLKPSNIFLPGDRTIAIDQLAESDFRVAEFGLAKAVLAVGRSPQAGLPWPSPQYLPPEHSSSHPLTPTGDVYAFGVMLYEFITARSPVQGTTRDEIAKQTRHGKIRSPHDLGIDIGQPANELVMRCLSQDQAARPQTGQQLAELLLATITQPAGSPAAATWWKRLFGWK